MAALPQGCPYPCVGDPQLQSPQSYLLWHGAPLSKSISSHVPNNISFHMLSHVSLPTCLNPCSWHFSLNTFEHKVLAPDYLFASSSEWNRTSCGKQRAVPDLLPHRSPPKPCNLCLTQCPHFLAYPLAPLHADTALAEGQLLLLLPLRTWYFLLFYHVKNASHYLLQQLSQMPG